MKLFVTKASRTVLAFAALAGALTACGGGESKDSSSTTSDDVLSFVAVTKSSWDAETTIGKHIYTLAMDLKKDNTLTFKGACIGKKAESQGGGGFNPFGAKKNTPQIPTSSDATPAAESSEESSEDFSKLDFSFSGTWTEETGYGYVLTFADTSNTKIHVDYNTTQGRHEFYYIVKNDEGSTQVLMQAKDSAYRKKLATDYKTWDERGSTYIFTGNVKGNNNSVDIGYIYCHNDGSAVYNTANGSARSVTIGLSWKSESDTIVLVDGNSTYKADKTLAGADHTGYRLAYKTYSFFCPTGKTTDWSVMTNGDFDGKTLYQFTGSYTTSGPDGSTKAVELNLSENANKAFLYSGGSLSNTGTWAFANEVFTITMDGADPVTVSKNDAGSYVYSFQITVSSFFGTSKIDVVLTYTPGA